MAQVLSFKRPATNVVRFMRSRFEDMEEKAIVAYVKNVLSPMVERGERSWALEELTSIIETVDFTRKPLAIAAALGIRIVLRKHSWQNEGNIAYLGAMQADICTGINLQIPDEDKAAFHLRDGDVSASIGDHRTAEMKYELAYRCVRKGSLEEVEYLGHYGEALANNSKSAAGLEKIKRALEIMSCDLTGSPEHRYIIISGLYGRLAKCAFKNWRFILAIRAYREGLRLAKILAYDYGMPQRLNQFRLRLRGKGV